MTKTPETPTVERYTEIANKLAAWIDSCPLPPTELHDVYTAHVLLMELVRQHSDYFALLQQFDALKEDYARLQQAHARLQETAKRLGAMAAAAMVEDVAAYRLAVRVFDEADKRLRDLISPRSAQADSEP